MPDTMTVVIVARTKMYGGRVCIGALSESGENIRLMDVNCASTQADESQFQVGERWRIDCEPCGERKPPHLEDVAVTQAAPLGAVTNLVRYILERAEPWRGSIDALFDGTIQFTQKGGGFISESAVPTRATGFWIPSSALERRVDDRGKEGYYPEYDYRHLSYVGVQDPIERIRVRQLVRVSLARWWTPREADSSFEERCYAQLSGWY